MTMIKTTIRNGWIELRAPEELPDGTEVLVEVSPILPPKIGLAESEWRDDPEALADWDAWLKTLAQGELIGKTIVEPDEFDEVFRKYNIEAVRRQMQEGTAE